MIVNPETTVFYWIWLSVVSLVAYLAVRGVIRFRLKNWTPRHQWKIFAAYSVFLLLPWIVYKQLFDPLIGGVYSSETAAYWIGRAAGEGDPARKEALIARLVLGSEPGKNAFVVKQAIGGVQNARERCTLRKILAGLPKIPDREDRENEAREECGGAPKP